MNEELETLRAYMEEYFKDCGIENAVITTIKPDELTFRFTPSLPIEYLLVDRYVKRRVTE